jgi:hypothetical protein
MGGSFFGVQGNNYAVPTTGFFSGSEGPGVPGGSSNQYGPLPPSSSPAQPLTQQTSPGIVPPSGNPPSTYTAGVPTTGGGSLYGSGSTQTENAVSPTLQDSFNNYLLSELGQGATPFNLSTVLPSSGAATAPGTLNAPTTATLQDLQNFFEGKGSASPEMNTLGNVAQNGVSALPAWQAMVAAQQRNISEGASQLREQFNTTGDLSSSPFATGMTDYYNQSILNQNATLANMQFQGMQEQIGAATTLEQAQQSLGQMFQGMDQQSINNLLSEFVRTQPEYSPLLNVMYSAGNTYSPLAGKTYGVGASGAIASGLAGAGAALQGATQGSASSGNTSGTSLA